MFRRRRETQQFSRQQKTAERRVWGQVTYSELQLRTQSGWSEACKGSDQPQLRPPARASGHAQGLSPRPEAVATPRSASLSKLSDRPCGPTSTVLLGC